MATTPNLAAVPKHPAEIAARDALRAVADGRAALPKDGAARLTAELALETDERRRRLAATCDDLVRMLLEQSAHIDVEATLALIERFSGWHREHAADLRRTLQLLHHMTQPDTPRVTVRAAIGQVALAASNHIDLGDQREDR